MDIALQTSSKNLIYCTLSSNSVRSTYDNMYDFRIIFLFFFIRLSYANLKKKCYRSFCFKL